MRIDKFSAKVHKVLLHHTPSKSEEPQKFECDKRIPYNVPKAGATYKNRVCGWQATKV